ncbi:MAG: hypothetical protein ACLSE4_02205 [Clostridium sp.]
MQEQGLEHRICDGYLELESGCYLVGTLSAPMILSRFRIACTAPRRPVGEDDFSDEICMVLDGAEGQTVIVGCSHPGILNIFLTTAASVWLKPLSRAAFGGYTSGRSRCRTDPRHIGTDEADGSRHLSGFNHCSGELLPGIMDQETGSGAHCYLGAGTAFTCKRRKRNE